MKPRAMLPCMFCKKSFLTFKEAEAHRIEEHKSEYEERLSHRFKIDDPKMYRPKYGSTCSRCGHDVYISQICPHRKHHIDCCRSEFEDE